ncbi:MAG: DUF1304 domain-containing protein [Acidimicrobiales bacterium]
MNLISRGLIAVIAILHLYIAWFEIFAWTEVGPDVFSMFEPELFADTIDLAANQGVYNLFLAAGLIWSLFISDPQWRFRVAICFLGFVAIAGIAAAVTLEIGSGLPQLVPSLLALAVTVLGHRGQAEVTSTT